MRAMDNNWFGETDIRIGFTAGVVCAVIKLLDVYLLTDPYTIVLIKVFFTAIIGGFGGVLGKHLFSYLKKQYDIKFKNKKP